MRLLILPLMLIVFVSGCTTITPIINSGTGLVITDFEPEFPEVYSTERIKFTTRIQNTGSLPALNIQEEIVGIEDWDLVSVDQLECEHGFGLIPADSVTGTVGETKLCSWTYIAPNVPDRLSVTYKPVARVYYNYLSNTVSSVSIVPRNELRRLQNAGQSLPIDTQSSTPGPVRIDITTEPVLSFEPSITFPLKITINNVDSGIACRSNCKDSANWNKVKLIFDLGGSMRLMDCNDMELSLYKGKTNSVTCKVEAFNIPDNSIDKRTIKVSAEYDYLIEMSTEVTVLSRPN